MFFWQLNDVWRMYNLARILLNKCARANNQSLKFIEQATRMNLEWTYFVQQNLSNKCNTRVNKRYTNELRLHSNESDPEYKMVKKGFKSLKFWKSLPIPIRWAFLFSGSIIKTS